MVDFSKPINNGDMINGLNVLVKRNLDMLSVLEKAEHAPAAKSLQAMHQRHLNRLAETIEVLGGAPEQQGDWHRWVDSGQISLSRLAGDSGEMKSLLSQEKSLNKLYGRALQKLKASPEAVDVLRDLISEERQQLNRMESDGHTLH